MADSPGPGANAAVRANDRSTVHAVGQPVGSFLSTAQVVVLDVLRGSAPGTRRLLLGKPDGLRVSYATAVADHAGSASAVHAEQRLLGDLSALLPAPLAATVPQVIGPIDVGGRTGLVVKAVPGLVPERRRRQPASVRAFLQAVRKWQVALWHETSGASGPVDLGADAADVLFTRYVGSAELAPCLGAVHRARQRLGSLEVRHTVTHGCLCARHANVADGTVVGVDDWTLGAASAEPLRDLCDLAVSYAGPRLPELVTGRTAFAHGLRDYLLAGLRTVGLPEECWRDVLLLTQLERAVDELGRGHIEGMDLLARTVRALPRERRYNETRKT
jgi:hypothetical protein